MDQQILSLINYGAVIVFVVLVLLGFFRILYRYFQYKRAGMKIPALLPRDLFLFGGLAVPFVGFLFFRAAGIIAVQEWWYPIWLIFSDTFAILGTGYWVWYEFFGIERPQK